MNISYKWLKEYLEFDLTPEELSAALTSIGLETGGIEKVESVRGGLAGLVVGKVLTCVEHPDSDHLHITTTDIGLPEGPVQIVCGAPNVAAGQTVIVAPVGTVLYDPEGGEFKIKRSKIRGQESLGMICAEDEIGVGTSHAGIIVLEPDIYAPGTPARQVYNISDDYVLEVDLTPNRIDAASHYGVARDLAAYLSCHRSPVKAELPADGEFSIDAPDAPYVQVQVDAQDGVTRYCGVTIRGVKVEESPDWLKERLTAIGMHPINNVVDITNYILHGIGQPLHAFDAGKLAGGRVVVRRAADEEPFTTLDGVERKLNAADLMICDTVTAKCMAGVFGGLDSGVTENTVDIFLESACFNPTSVRRTARRHGISTDSSFRFERGVDPNGCLRALKIAAALIRSVAGGEICGQVVDYYPVPVPMAHIEMEMQDFARLIGGEIPYPTVENILTGLECEYKVNGNHLDVHVPTYRVDVTRPCDLIEDVLRIYGYNNIAMGDELHSCLSYKTDVDAADDLRRTISDQLCGAGFNEILNNSLTAEGYYTDNASLPASNCIKLLNPLSQDLNVLRQTLLYGGLQSLARNINRRNPDLAMYEFGNIYRLDPAVQATAEKPLAPYSEAPRLGIWLSGMYSQPGWLAAAQPATVYHLLATVGNVLTRAGIEYKTVNCESDDLWEQSVLFTDNHGTALGRAGIVSAKARAAADIKPEVYYAELEWDRISAQARKHNTLFTPLPKTQAVRRDLSLLLDKAVEMADLSNAVKKCEPRLIKSVELFDVYEGKNLPAGKKSYAISISMQDPEKTLQDKYIDKVMSKVVATLTKQFNAELR